MPTSQSTLESLEEKQLGDNMPSSDNKLTLQLLREQEKIALESINKLTEEEMTYYLDTVRMSGKEAYKALEYMIWEWIAIGDSPILRTLLDQLPEMQSKQLWTNSILLMLQERPKPLPVCNCTICSGELTGQQDLPQ